MTNYLLIVIALLVPLLIYLYIVKSREVERIKKNHEWSNEKAREKAAKIVEEAKNQALKIVEEVKVEAGNLQQELDTGVKKVTDEEIGEYQKVISNISEDIEKGVITRSEEFKNRFDESFDKLDDEMKKKINENFEQAQKKADEYVNENIQKIISEAALEVLGKQIDPETNKKLIIEALDKAKNKYGA